MGLFSCESKRGSLLTVEISKKGKLKQKEILNFAKKSEILREDIIGIVHLDPLLEHIKACLALIVFSRLFCTICLESNPHTFQLSEAADCIEAEIVVGSISILIWYYSKTLISLDYLLQQLCMPHYTAIMDAVGFGVFVNCLMKIESFLVNCNQLKTFSKING